MKRVVALHSHIPIQHIDSQVKKQMSV